MKCAKCGSEMVKRSGRFGSFYGCTGFPRCKNTVNIKSTRTYQSAPKENASPIRAGQFDNHLNPILEKLTDEQKPFYDFIINNPNKHVRMDSTAGSGKSFINMIAAKGLKNTYPADSNIYGCFNKPIQLEFVPKAYVDDYKVCEVSTLNSLGNRMVSKLARSMGLIPMLRTNKTWMIVDGIIPDELGDKRNMVVGEIKKYIDYCKCFMMEGTNEDIEYLSDRFDLDIQEGYPHWIRRGLEMSMDYRDGNKFLYDFNDQIWLPVIHGMKFEKIDNFLIDEAQDLNISQHHFIREYVEAGARVIIVGDYKQAIYGWRGADINSMSNLAELIGGAQEFTMETTFRNPISHVEYINKRLPDYPHKARPNAIQGEILDMNKDEIVADARPNSLMISLTNAPLVGYAFRLMKAGKPAYIVGRDFGASIIEFIESLDAKSIPDLIRKTEDKIQMDINKIKEVAAKRGREPNADTLISLEDKHDAIVEIVSGVKKENKRANVGHVIDRIKSLFAETTDGGKPKDAIVLSTIHRGKGLESDDVYILTPELMPHPAAKKMDEIKQQYNCLFVALTRSKNRMIFKVD